MYLAVQVKCFLLPGILARNDLHDIGTAEALLLHLLYRPDLGQGDERALLHWKKRKLQNSHTLRMRAMDEKSARLTLECCVRE